MQSILQEHKACYVTGRTWGLHKHHVFAGSRRKAAEEWGCFIWLIPELHNGDYRRAIHFNQEFDREVKQACQRAFEERYSREKFMEIFGKNYLDY